MVCLLRSRNWLVRSRQVGLFLLLLEFVFIDRSFRGTTYRYDIQIRHTDTTCLSPDRLSAGGLLTLYRSIAAVVAILFPGPLVVQTSLGGGTSVVQGLFIETFLTAQLVFTIFMLAAEKHKATFLAPVGIGLSLFIAHLTGLSS